MNVSSIAVAKMMSYDTSYFSNAGAHDISVPYERTYEMCNEHTVCLFSGNVIKKNSYSLTEPYIVSNCDAEFRIRLEKLRIEHSVVQEQEQPEIIEDISDDNINLLTADISDSEDEILPDSISDNVSIE